MGNFLVLGHLEGSVQCMEREVCNRRLNSKLFFAYYTMRKKGRVGGDLLFCLNMLFFFLIDIHWHTLTVVYLETCARCTFSCILWHVPRARERKWRILFKICISFSPWRKLFDYTFAKYGVLHYPFHGRCPQKYPFVGIPKTLRQTTPLNIHLLCLEWDLLCQLLCPCGSEPQ